MSAEPSGAVVLEAGQLEAAIENAIIAVLETMFYTSIVDMEAPPREDTMQAYAMRVRFEGPLHGELHLALERDTAAALASTMLDESGEVSPVRASQVAAELANMLCGSLLSHLEPPATMTLWAPEPIDWQPLSGDSNCTAFVLPEGRLTVRFQLDPDSDPAGK